MLAILTSHPIQYQVPVWRALATAAAVPFEVWYLTDQGVKTSPDAQFGKSFAWDLDMLGGYRHRFLTVNADWNLSRFRGVRLHEDLSERLRMAGVRALWVEGWRFSAFWKAVGVASRSGVKVWMRGESNDLKRDPAWKRLIKRVMLARHFRQVDRFLCIGSANRRLYESYGIPRSKLTLTPYCVDNDRFADRAPVLRAARSELRARWRIPGDAFCFLFCGKFIAKKRPDDLVQAARRLGPGPSGANPIHLFFVGSGALGPRLRDKCQIAFDAEGTAPANASKTGAPVASFAGFLNQSEIAAAYAAADALVLPSDNGETWGLVVNEAMVCGLPAVVSDQCGCAEDLPARVDKRLVFRCGDIGDLARAMRVAMELDLPPGRVENAADAYHLRHTVKMVEELYRRLVAEFPAADGDGC